MVTQRVLYIAPMAYGENPTVDAVAHGLQSRLAAAGIELRVLFAEFRSREWPESANAAFRAGIDAKVDATVAWLVTPTEPRAGIAEARDHGIPVITLERPVFAVDASIVWPNFNQGVYMAYFLASQLDAGARVAIVGGPPAVDDIELVHGLIHGVKEAGLDLVNDPWTDRHRNATDVATGGETAALAVLDDCGPLDGLIPFNDETMLGTLAALQQRGRLGEMKLVSRNGTPAAVQAVRDGLSCGTWDIDPPGIGTMLGDLVARTVIDGVPLNGFCQASPIGRMVTRELADSWVAWEQRVTYRPLSVGL